MSAETWTHRAVRAVRARQWKLRHDWMAYRRHGKHGTWTLIATRDTYFSNLQRDLIARYRSRA